MTSTRDDDAVRAFGEQLRARREGRTYHEFRSQAQLAERAGLHRNEIWLLESGRRDPRLSTIVRLARALDVPAADLLRGVH